MILLARILELTGEEGEFKADRKCVQNVRNDWKWHKGVKKKGVSVL